MDNSMFVRFICLAYNIIGLFPRGTSAVDVLINRIVDYDGVKVFLLHRNMSICFRHQPTDGNLVTRVLVDDVDGTTFTTSAPYLDVLIHVKIGYFKIINADWSASTPFIGDKYKYYKVKNGVVNQCDGVTYSEIYRISYLRHLTLSIWRSQTHIDRYTVAEGRISVPKPGVFIRRVNVEYRPLWQYERSKGIIFLKALERKIHFRSLITLYLKDLNDNEIEMNFLLWKKGATFLDSWKGYPREYDVPSAKLPSACVQPRLEPIPLIVNITRDTTDSPLLKIRNHEQGERGVCVYIAHPNAHIKRFVSPQIKQDFQRDNIFIVTYTARRGYAELQLLLYEEGTTSLLAISSDDPQNAFTTITGPSVLVYSFPLHLEAEVDERMYTQKFITIGGIKSAVFTARPHLSFSQVYDDGTPLFVEGEPNVIVEQFILQDSRIYVVIRAVDELDHERYYRDTDDSSWQRANDDYPDYILCLQLS